MKYTISRKFSLKNKKYKIIRDLKTLCTAKAIPSKEYEGRYNVKLSNPINKYIGEDTCIVEPNENRIRTYSIYIIKNNEKTFFGQLSYQLCNYYDYLYTIVIGEKLYRVRSSDLKDRRLVIIDTVQSTNSSQINCPETLFQVTDPFSKSNKNYHVTIDDKKWQYGYLAIVILLDLHERRRNIS